MPLTDDTRAKAREIIARYPQSRSALLPMLHLVQAEEGYVTPKGVTLCAEELGLTKAEVGAVATFYTMYKRRPVGDYLVSVCTNLSCQVLGGEEVYASVSEHLGVGHDETAPGVDGGPSVTLEHAECLAACDYAPVMTVNYEFFDNVTESSALEAVQALQRGDRPMPTRGAPLGTFREVSLELAGFVDPDPSTGTVRGGAPPQAHPDAPRPDDRRGTVDLEGTDIAPAGQQGYGVAGGATEQTLSGTAAAATYGDTHDADAGATEESDATSPRRDDDTALAGMPADAGAGVGDETVGDAKDGGESASGDVAGGETPPPPSRSRTRRRSGSRAGDEDRAADASRNDDEKES